MTENQANDANGLEDYRAYTRQKSTIVNSGAGAFDWFASTGDLRYS